MCGVGVAAYLQCLNLWDGSGCRPAISNVWGREWLYTCSSVLICGVRVAVDLQGLMCGVGVAVDLQCLLNVWGRSGCRPAGSNVWGGSGLVSQAIKNRLGTRLGVAVDP